MCPRCVYTLVLPSRTTVKPLTPLRPANPQTEAGLPLSQPASPWWQMYELFFSISYIAPELEPVVKSRINAFFQVFLPKLDR